MDRYDLVVIGSGPAGEKGAAQAAYFGKRVAVVEREPYPGGAGINTGTVPSKTLRETALYFSGLRQRGLYGVDYHVNTDLTVKDFMYRQQEVVRSLRQVVIENIERHRIDFVQGDARFEDPHTIRVSREGQPDRLLHGDVVLIATGSVPTRPPDVPFTDPRVHDSDEILELQRLPGTLAVVGAGVIGCEYTTIFAALGIKVSLIDGRDRLLGFLDAEMADQLRLQMGFLGVDLRLEERVARYVPGPDGVRLVLKRGGSLTVDQVLVAAGRVANVQRLAIDRAGLAVDERGLLTVDEQYRTAVPHIYAAGDVIGFPGLASTSMEQGRLASCHAFKVAQSTLPKVMPYGIYTIPEISTVGKNEEELTKENVPYEVGRAFYKEIARGQIFGDLDGLLKLIFHRDTLQLLGVHIIGEGATEL
ncbi:MAG TPA: Si-specific NAD(P)(+) transhydrogenase, partial [Methylomirabilota bacterium]